MKVEFTAKVLVKISTIVDDDTLTEALLTSLNREVNMIKKNKTYYDTKNEKWCIEGVIDKPRNIKTKIISEE